jgi:hypothetical protein
VERENVSSNFLIKFESIEFAKFTLGPLPRALKRWSLGLELHNVTALGMKIQETRGELLKAARDKQHIGKFGPCFL